MAKNEIAALLSIPDTWSGKVDSNRWLRRSSRTPKASGERIKDNTNTSVASTAGINTTLPRTTRSRNPGQETSKVQEVPEQSQKLKASVSTKGRKTTEPKTLQLKTTLKRSRTPQTVADSAIGFSTKRARQTVQQDELNARDFSARDTNENDKTVNVTADTDSAKIDDTQDEDIVADDAMSETLAALTKKPLRLRMSLPKLPKVVYSNAEVPSTAKIAFTGQVEPTAKTVPKLKALKITAVDARPEPHGKPPIWSDSRQGLCETLPYYRAFQSGPYTTRGIVLGSYLGHSDDYLSYMDNEIAITRCGGHSAKDENGVLQQKTDQSETEATVRSFKKSMKEKVAIVLIAGRDNKDCPSVLPHEFNVLAHFMVTDMWYERTTNGKKCMKLRFEKLRRETKSWWAPKGDSEPLSTPDYPGPAVREVCKICTESSPQIYAEGWMCLQAECPRFWLIDDAPPPDTLSYNPAFLKERTNFGDIRPPYTLVPKSREAEVDLTPYYGRNSWKGTVCPYCGACIPRVHWDRWECGTDGCGWVQAVKAPIVSAASVQAHHFVEYDGWAPCTDKYNDSTVQRTLSFNRYWRISTYELIDGCYVTHYQANGPLNEASGGANSLFKDLQQNNCMGLQRFKMNAAFGKGTFLASHFSVNFGMPYKYVVAVDSRCFAGAPPGIISAMNRMEWAGRRAIAAVQSLDENFSSGKNVVQDNMLDHGATQIGHESMHNAALAQSADENDAVFIDNGSVSIGTNIEQVETGVLKNESGTIQGQIQRIASGSNTAQHDMLDQEAVPTENEAMQAGASTQSAVKIGPILVSNEGMQIDNSLAETRLFNELLAVGYFEGAKMGYHDDGEQQLGPNVATLSLGGSATMNFKMKDKYHKGLTKGGNYNADEEVPRGCALEAERKALNKKHKDVSSAEFDILRKKMYKNGGAKAAGAAKKCLEVHLLHGDIIVMTGAKMQKFFEHEVIPSDQLRFALTSRWVNKEHVHNDDHWKADLGANVGVPYDGGPRN